MQLINEFPEPAGGVEEPRATIVLFHLTPHFPLGKACQGVERIYYDSVDDTLNGLSDGFSSWSDGGSFEHYELRSMEIISPYRGSSHKQWVGFKAFSPSFCKEDEQMDLFHFSFQLQEWSFWKGRIY